MGVASTPGIGRLLPREEFRRWCGQQTSGRRERIDGRIVVRGGIDLDPPGITISVEDIDESDAAPA